MAERGVGFEPCAVSGQSVAVASGGAGGRGVVSAACTAAVADEVSAALTFSGVTSTAVGSTWLPEQAEINPINMTNKAILTHLIMSFTPLR